MLKPKSDKHVFVGCPKRISLGNPFTINLKTKVFVVRSGEFLVKKFLAKGFSGRKNIT
jgi:hypothetical protein